MLLLSIPALFVCCSCAKLQVLNLIKNTNNNYFKDKDSDERLVQLMNIDTELRSKEFDLLCTKIELLWLGLVCILNIISFFI